MLEHYLPLQGSAFAEWLDASAPLGARIEATKLFALAPGAECAGAGLFCLSGRERVTRVDGGRYARAASL